LQFRLQRVVDLERRGEPLSLAGAALVVQVGHRRLDVRLPHPGLDLDDVGDVYRQRAERVPQVVEAKRPQPRTLLRGPVAAPQGRPVGVAAVVAREHRVLVVSVGRVEQP
jgi:hypothetical protein